MKLDSMIRSSRSVPFDLLYDCYVKTLDVILLATASSIVGENDVEERNTFHHEMMM